MLNLDRQDVAQLRKLTVCDDDGGERAKVSGYYGRIGRDQAWLVYKGGTFRG